MLITVSNLSNVLACFRRNEWLTLINREDLIASSCSRARVCEAHFSPNSTITNSRRKLIKKNSVPQLCLPLQNFADKGIQAVIATADANVQCDYGFQTNAQVQTPLYLLEDPLRKRKLLTEVQICRKKLKITDSTQSEANTFLKLCDKFLTPKFSLAIKQQIEMKIQRHQEEPK